MSVARAFGDATMKRNSELAWEDQKITVKCDFVRLRMRMGVAFPLFPSLFSTRFFSLEKKCFFSIGLFILILRWVNRSMGRCKISGEIEKTYR